MGRSASGWRFHRSGESWRRRSRARKQAQTSGGWLAGPSPPPSVSDYRHPVEGAGTPLLDLGYLISTLAPCSSRAALIFSASSFVTPSLIGLGDASTRSLASLSPRPVSSRTTLMTGILLGPISVRVAVNSVCSSGAAAASVEPPPAAGAAAAATGAAAVTP